MRKSCYGHGDGYSGSDFRQDYQRVLGFDVVFVGLYFKWEVLKLRDNA